MRFCLRSFGVVDDWVYLACLGLVSSHMRHQHVEAHLLEMLRTVLEHGLQAASVSWVGERAHAQERIFSCGFTA